MDSVKFIEELPNGIFLEDRNFLIPWGTPLFKLNQLPLPFNYLEPMNYDWEWLVPSCSILGGLQTSLSIRYSKDDGDQPLTSIGNKVLAGGSFETSVSKFREMHKHVLAIAGEPASHKKNDSSTWIIKNSKIYLYVWERFDWFCGISFENTGQAH